ncbi:MAG: energy-coupling factor transporter ATPase [Clostridiales bacterium]|nr:energy-coupling factor transporter ATPase [Clostridiales bacterium]
MSIIVSHLTHIYNKGLAYETTAVHDLNFEIEQGAFTAIVGHTGSGKSTLVQHLNGLIKPTSGSVTVNGVDVSGKNTSVLAVRKKIGMVFQYPEYQLFEETVYRDVAFGPHNLELSETEIDERVREALALVGLDFDEFAQRSPFELSGGQKRRAAIAGVLAMRPEVLILDEPTAGLDPCARDDVLRLVSNVRTETGCTIVLVSHNMEDVAQYADQILVLNHGEAVRMGTPREVFADGAFLTEIGLALPPARAFAGRLEARGLPISAEDVLTRDTLVSALAFLLRETGERS